jgi:hypothetical protein
VRKNKDKLLEIGVFRVYSLLDGYIISEISLIFLFGLGILASLGVAIGTLSDLGYKVSDPMSGFFMFRKLIYYKYKNRLFGKGWKILADLIYNKETFLIEQLQVKFLRRSGDSSKMNLNVLINVMRLFLFKLRMLKI